MSHAEKPEKFTGVNFKQWQQKMFFYLTTLNLARFLTETVPQVDEGAMDTQSLSAVQAWNHSDFLCRNYVLNGMVDALYNVYCKTKTAKELWESLDRKYKTEDAGTKKSVVAKFLDFKMIDSKTVMSQVQDSQVILHDIHAEGMSLSETFQVACSIEKLPPSWVNFKNYLKHKRKEMTIEDLFVHLRIEEDNKIALKRIDGPGTTKASVVEHGQSLKDWWVDTRATRHVCFDKSLFSTFKEVTNGEKVFMGNSATAEVKGEGNVVLKMTSGK
ncbi:uncharacterized protein LOC143630481 [Bidens hawaiensis]|uniref:uncharacterized protein LOC143630481 n=1 Tax=Bidens hawaiensis TaxID=980011 RepID=UPI00404AFCBF